MPSVRSLIAARERSHGGLRALATALHGQLRPTAALPADPAALWEAVEEHGSQEPDTWQEVRAAVDHGELSEAEYDYLAAATAALEEADEDD